MYQLVAENLQKARKRIAPANFPQLTKLKTEDSVMIKDHTAGPFEPVYKGCLLYTSPSPRDATLSRMPSSA